jgi:energy-coupling factor transporter ATP-binding protein EcfA2
LKNGGRGGIFPLRKSKSKPLPQAIWIDLHRQHTVNEPLKVLLTRLNERREWLRNGLKIPIIFILSTQTDVGRYAPDFWSVRDLVLFLDNTVIYSKVPSETINPLLNFWLEITAWFSGIRRRYNQHINEHRVFNIKGLRTHGTYTIELEQVFVELRIAPSTAPNQSHRDLLTIKELQGNKPIWEFLRYGKTVKGQLLLAIIGAPGCGKTTLLQHIALTLATKPPRGLPKWLPILLFLRQHVKTIVANKPLLAKVVQQHFANPNRYPDLEPPTNWFHQQLQAGRCLVLLDGLDEVANAEERKYISAWIDEQIVNYPRCAFIVTSRPQGYQAAPLARATVVLEVQAFTIAQVRQFIAAWYLATEIMSFGGKKDAGVRLRAKQEAEDLHQRLHARPALLALTVNPLLLTMIAMVHRYRGQLPGRRVELYAEICDVLLGHWREAKGIQDNLTAAQKRVALQPLAAWVMEKSVREIEIATAIEVIREPLQTVGLANSDLDNFLKDIQASSGLLAEREMGVWSFAHLTFQEYLAAAHFKEQKVHGNWWQRKVADSWWQETLRLYAAQADATPIVTACLNNQNVMTLTLAADCLEEALKLAAPVRQQVEEVLIANLESDNPELFKLAAEVKLQRRLKNLHRIDETREIDVEFISCAEYQLFLDERRAKGEFYQPDHWMDYRFPKGSAGQPIVGMQANDAEAFCEWLSEREKVKYRCPTCEDAKKFSPVIDNLNHLATWCKNHNEWGLCWQSSPAQQNIKLKLEKLISEKSWFDRALACDLSLDFSLTSDLAHDFARALNPDLTSALFRGRVLYHHTFPPNLFPNRALERALDIALIIEDKVLQDALEERNFTAAQQRLQELQPTVTVEQRKKSLLTELLTILSTNNYLKQRRAWRRYIAYLAEYAVISYEMLEKENGRTWWQRLLHWHKLKNSYTNEKKYLAQLGAWLLITNARQEGKLPAWEGIRIVRDRTSESGFSE